VLILRSSRAECALDLSRDRTRPTKTQEWVGEGTQEEKFCDAALEPLAILKFDSAMSRSSIGNSGAEVRNVFCFRQTCCRGTANPDVCFTPKRTSELSRAMSALCQERTLRSVKSMSAIPLKADIAARGLHVRFVPIAAHNVKTAARTSKLTPARPVESSVPTRRARSNRK
jgi:hypothetical protein